jgi:uncharacterized protein (TIGR02996 family)
MAHDPFLRTLAEQPDDPVSRAVYADWLDEQGDPASAARAEFLRAEAELVGLPEEDERRPELVARLRRLARQLDRGWLRAVSRPPIENCEFRFFYQCPLQWDKLTPTDDARVRFCSGCQQNVYYCDSIDEARSHASQERCVAVAVHLARSAVDLMPRRTDLDVVGLLG